MNNLVPLTRRLDKKGNWQPCPDRWNDESCKRAHCPKRPKYRVKNNF